MTTEPFPGIVRLIISGRGPYPMPWPYGPGDVVAGVRLTDGALAQLAPADFAITPGEAEVTGSLTLSDTIATIYRGSVLEISRDTRAEQGWKGLASHRERGLEAQLDLMTRAIQDLRGLYGRTVRADRDLPVLTPRPNTVIGFDPAGNLTLTGTLGGDVGTLVPFLIEAVEGQTVVSVPTYPTDQHAIVVIKNGAIQTAREFSETGTTSITLARPAQAGDIIHGWVRDRTAVPVSPITSVSLEDVPGFDPANAHLAAAALAMQYRGRALPLRFRRNSYIFRATTLFDCPAVAITAEPGHELIVTDGIAADRAALEFGSQTALEPAGAARQAITASLARGAASCTVAAGAAFAPGDWAVIVSGSGPSTGEYWYGLPGEDGFDTARKTELVQVAHVIGNVVYFAQPTVQSYDCVTYAVELRRLALQGDIITFDDLNWRGPGGGASHGDVHSPSTGPRAINVFGYRRVVYRGGRVTNFPRFGLMFYSCLSGQMSGTAFEGWDCADPTNFSADPAYRSIWFTGALLSGGTDWIVSGCSARNMRRLIDTDRGPLIPRNMIFALNTADGCQYVWSGHVAERVAYLGNIGQRCAFGIMTRARHVRVADNHIQCGRYGLQIGPIEGDGIDWPATLANAGTIEMTDNTVEVTNGEYFASMMSFDRLVIRGNTCFGSIHPSRDGILIMGRVMRDLIIAGNLVDLSAAGAAATGNCINIHDDDRGAGGKIAVQDGVSISGNDLRGGAQGLRLCGVNGTPATTLGSRSKNIHVDGANTYRNHRLRDIRFETDGCVYDGQRVRILPGQTYGARELFPRVSYGQDQRSWSEVPLTDASPDELPSGRMVGKVAAPYDGAGNVIPYSTLVEGMHYRSRVFANGSPVEYVADEGGTYGTLTGVTGTITAGLALLVVNSAANLFVGAFIRVAGAGAAGAQLIARIDAIAGSTVTLDTVAATSVATAAVTFKPPVILIAGAAA